MNPIDKLLPLLSKCKSTGQNKWSACCPAHEDRSPSLAIKEREDGSLLIHCFSGCSAPDVVGSVGLTLSDLYPNNPQHYNTERAPFPALQVLKMIKNEISIVSLALSDVLAGRPISQVDLERIELARERLIEAIRLAGG